MTPIIKKRLPNGLWILRSDLANDIRRRKATSDPVVALGESKEILGAGAER